MPLLIDDVMLLVLVLEQYVPTMTSLKTTRIVFVLLSNPSHIDIGNGRLES